MFASNKRIKYQSETRNEDKRAHYADMQLTARENIFPRRKEPRKSTVLTLYLITQPRDSPTLLFSLCCQLSYLAHVCPLWPCMASSLLPSILLTSVLLLLLSHSLLASPDMYLSPKLLPHEHMCCRPDICGALYILRMQMQHETVTQSVKRLDACVCLCMIVFSHSNEKLSHACVWVCVCLFEWSSLWPLNSWLLSVCLFTFSTNRTEGLLEHLALLLASSKTFDVRGQQLCINGPEPIRSQIELLNTGLFEWHDDFVISEW